MISASESGRFLMYDRLTARSRAARQSAVAGASSRAAYGQSAAQHRLRRAGLCATQRRPKDIRMSIEYRFARDGEQCLFAISVAAAELHALRHPAAKPKSILLIKVADVSHPVPKVGRWTFAGQCSALVNLRLRIRLH